MEKTELFVCRCHDVSHQMVLETLEPIEDEERVVYGCFHIVTPIRDKIAISCM